ncbi:hypothetical protein Tco_0123322 [Tanacetum coccineum]
MILPADHVLRAVINARLPVPLLLLVCFWSYLFHAVMLPYQVGDVPLTCIAAVDYVSGIHVASSDYWLASFFACLFKMTNFAVKHSIMTREMVENFCNNYYIPDEVYPVAPGRDKTITRFLKGKVGVYTSAFYTRTYSDELFSFAKRSTSSPSCFPKPPDSIKNWFDHFLWVDAKVFPISVSLYVGGVLEKDPAPHLTARQEQTVRLLDNNKAPFRRYPECFLCLVDLSPYYPFEENTYPAFKRPDKTDCRPPEGPSGGSSKKDDQVKLLESTSHCFMSLVTPAVGGSSSTAAPEVSSPEVSAPAEVEPEIVVPEDTYLDLTEPDADLAAARLEEVLGGKTLAGLRPMLSFRDVAKSSQLETSEGSDDSFYELPALNSAKAKRYMDYEQLYTEFNVGVARQICLESEVRSRAEHELELKEKLKGKYDARSRLLEEKDLEIFILKSLLVEEAEKAERAETAKVVRLRDQVSALTAEVSALKSTIAQKDTDISLLDSRATYLKFTYEDFKEKVETQQEEQAQVLYNYVAELEAHVMDVSGRLEEEFYPAYLTTLAGRRWFLTHGIQLTMIKCLKSPEYQGILGHALGRARDIGMQEGLEAGYEHGVAGTQLSVVEAYNPEATKTSYFDAVRALEDVDFLLVNLLKSKKDVGMDEVLDCFILDGPLADLPEAAHLQPCLEHLSVPIHQSDDKAIVGETSLSFALLNVHSRAEGAKKHAAALH